MNDWLKWKGTLTSSMGISVTALPPVTVPEERVTFEDVRGRSGTLAILEGNQVYKDMILPAECILRDPTRLNEAVAWLQGKGEVEFANRPGGHYRARIVNQIELARIIAADPTRAFTVNFRCQPGWMHHDVEPVTLTESGETIENPGTLASYPRIEIAGSGTFALTIGLQTAYLQDIEDGIILDSALGDALTADGSNLANGHWAGEPIRIEPGVSYVTWFLEEGANVSSVKIIPRWMSL